MRAIFQERRDYRDRCVLSFFSDEWTGIVDLITRHGGRYGTFRASANRLVEAGELERVWDGNERFGRYVYRRIYKQ